MKFSNTTQPGHTGKALMILMFVFLTSSLFQTATAQRNELGVMFGGSFYMGDLNPKLPLVMVNPGAGAFYRLNFNHHWSVRANILYMKVEGNDAYVRYNPDRKLSFFSNIYEFSVQTEVNFLQYQAGNLNTPFTPYLFAGLGAFSFHPKRLEPGGVIIDLTDSDQREEYNLPTKETDYALVSYSFLFGMGFKFNITRNVSTGVEWGMRRTGTDYLDDVKYRGNPKNNDWYSFFGLMMSVTINDPDRAVCPYPD